MNENNSTKCGICTYLKYNIDLIFYFRYKKYFNFESHVKLEEKFNRVIFGNWQEMFIFPRFGFLL